MMAAAVTFYGFLVSFILSAAGRNHRAGRTNPLVLTVVGYVLCGLTAGSALILPTWAFMDPHAVEAVTSLL